MRLSEIEKKARLLGIKDTWKYSKQQLIKAIQHKEGFSECFGTAKGYCQQFNCCWRSDCVR